MRRPTILTLDDDPEVSRAVERDLRTRYGKDYRIVRVESGPVALDVLRHLHERDEPLALMVVDQRMPEMSGVEFLEQAIQLYPDAKRVLLTAYADTEAAIRAINAARIHYYLMKPWDPPEQHLYPFLNDLLDDWRRGWKPPFEGIRLVGHRWSARAHALRDFLGRNQIPFRWLDVDVAEEARRTLERLEAEAGERPRLPVVLLPDGSTVEDPEPRELAARLGLRTQAGRPFYDLAVIGAGPAGLAAAVYGASEGLHTVLLEREAPGGQAGTSSNIENYLGFPAGLSGADLTRRAVAQALKFGSELLNPQEVTGVRVDGQYRVVTLGDGSEISARTLLIATGVAYRKLDIPGADALTGAGIYYGAAMTEAFSCRGEHVYVVGGGNSAGQAAMHFAQYAEQVTILCRGQELGATMSRYLVDQIEAQANVEVRLRTKLVEAMGAERLEALRLQGPDGPSETVPASSVFVFIGAAPRTDWLAGLVARDERGFILTGPDLPRLNGRPAGWELDRDPFLLEASVPGVFAAGDVRHQSIKRVASAVGEGSIAVQFTHQYLAVV